MESKFFGIEKVCWIDFIVRGSVSVWIALFQTSSRAASDTFQAFFELLPLPGLMPHNVLYDTFGNCTVKNDVIYFKGTVNSIYPQALQRLSKAGHWGESHSTQHADRARQTATQMHKTGHAMIRYFDISDPGKRLWAWTRFSTCATIFALKYSRGRDRPTQRGLALHKEMAGRLSKIYGFGAGAGLLASQFVNPSVQAYRFHVLYAELFARWLTFIAAADAAIDTKRLSEHTTYDLLWRVLLALNGLASSKPSAKAVRELVLQCREVLGRKPESVSPLLYQKASHDLEDHSILLAQQAFSSLKRLHAYHKALGSAGRFEDQLSTFRSLTIGLMRGQIRSLGQRIVDEKHDWAWYLSVAYDKSQNVFLSPISLLTAVDGDQLRQQCLIDCGVLLNQFVFGRQVLDDFRDFSADMAVGVAGAPIYLIIGQATVAERITRPLATPTQIVEAIIRSELLRSGSWAWRECQLRLGVDSPSCTQLRTLRLDSEQLSLISKYALANTRSEMTIDTRDLARGCIDRRDLLIAAWNRADWNTVTSVVRSSAVANRVLWTITDARHCAATDEALRNLAQEDLKEVFAPFVFRLKRSIRKVMLEWQTDVR